MYNNFLEKINTIRNMIPKKAVILNKEDSNIFFIAIY